MSDQKKLSRALPSKLYGDPAEAVDEMRKLREAATRQAERQRVHKCRRIRALVREVMRKGGGNHGR